MLLLLMAVAICLFALMNGGYALREMDWNEDGTTDLAEVLASLDIGKREIVYRGKHCLEYYSLKDGLTLKTRCGQSAR
ncbi:hypothetical protein GCM10007860_04950 [Chitiniphilus shinanonensis]|uniref:EF-hand domain-containing protein n=1 Tax=Chitiniphilus shinanonensis TaxID=553088 RepID=A0ABQ6BT14_9NEIS|nr:hypothetical protein [Chitiniphilus shinanonensis]GLS03352.1 hypothetical protein GCM10007860_04950 [Chitiniphilus shinanonensis]